MKHIIVKLVLAESDIQDLDKANIKDRAALFTLMQTIKRKCEHSLLHYFVNSFPKLNIS